MISFKRELNTEMKQYHFAIQKLVDNDTPCCSLLVLDNFCELLISEVMHSAAVDMGWVGAGTAVFSKRKITFFP